VIGASPGVSARCGGRSVGPGEVAAPAEVFGLIDQAGVVKLIARHGRDPIVAGTSNDLLRALGGQRSHVIRYCVFVPVERGPTATRLPSYEFRARCS
jgi:hypothetical protein